MSGNLDDYRNLLAKSFATARTRVFGDPAKLAEEETKRVRLAAYKDRPLRFVREVLGERTWSASRAELRALIKKKRVLACGCRKSSKSHTSAQATLAMTCPVPTRTIITSATYTQVRENTFARIRKLHAGALIPLPGTLGVTSLRIDPTWYAIGISTNKPGNIMGFHADIDLPKELEYDEEWIDEDSLLPPDARLADDDAARAERDAGEVIDEEVYRAKKDNARLFFVLDELAEMRADIVEALQGSWMGENVYVLAQMNPTFQYESTHPARRFLEPTSGWWRVHIAGREPPVDMHPPDLFDECFHRVPDAMMPEKWVEERKAEWGPTAALTAVHVFGCPSNPEREREFIPYSILRDQFDRELRDDGRLSSRHMGWDVAASKKGDFNVVQLWVNGQLTEEEQWHNPDTIASAERVWDLGYKWGLEGKRIPGRNVHVDKLGIGKGPTDYLHRKGWWVDAVDAGAEPQGDWQLLTGDQVFANRKAELLWVLRRGLQEGIFAIPGTKRPDGTHVFADTIKQCQWYTVAHVPRASGTAIKCKETRDEIVELFGRSPDNLSAAMLACSRTNRPVQIGTFDDLRQLNSRMQF